MAQLRPPPWPLNPSICYCDGSRVFRRAFMISRGLSLFDSYTSDGLLFLQSVFLASCCERERSTLLVAWFFFLTSCCGSDIHVAGYPTDSGWNFTCNWLLVHLFLVSLQALQTFFFKIVHHRRCWLHNSSYKFHVVEVWLSFLVAFFRCRYNLWNFLILKRFSYNVTGCVFSFSCKLPALMELQTTLRVYLL